MGGRLGPAEPWHHTPLSNAFYTRCVWKLGELLYQGDGTFNNGESQGLNLVAEWVDNPNTDREQVSRLGASDIEDHEPAAQEPAIVTSEPAYARLATILQAAINQAQDGKGAVRHTDDVTPFLQQPIMNIARMLGGDTGGHAYQIIKKTQEAHRMVRRENYHGAVSDLLGAINYAAAMILLITEIDESGSTEFAIFGE